ncbi:MAG: hypothetical protein KA439_13595 [Rhizobacter sp.]|nr:hypothetical protein [Rhizobacter sp.]
MMKSVHASLAKVDILNSVVAMLTRPGALFRAWTVWTELRSGSFHIITRCSFSSAEHATRFLSEVRRRAGARNLA